MYLTIFLIYDINNISFKSWYQTIDQLIGRMADNQNMSDQSVPVFAGVRLGFHLKWKSEVQLLSPAPFFVSFFIVALG